MEATFDISKEIVQQVKKIRTYTTAYMRNNIEALNDYPGLFGVPPQGHGEASVVTTRSIIVLPARYVALFLRGQGYTPKEMWDLLLPTLVDDNQHEDCLPLIDWL
jgi:hypothetical protein